MNIRVLILASFSFLALGCTTSGSISSSPTPEAPTAVVLPTPPPLDSRPKLVAFGDSFTVGSGIADWRKNYPSLLQADLDRAGYDLQVVNRGRGGDSSTQGLARLDEAFTTGDVRFFVLALGGNDVARHIPLDETITSLDAIIKTATARGAKVLICGYRPPDPELAPTMAGMYSQLSAQNHAALLPSLLDGVEQHPDLLQPDGVHPNEAGARVVEQNVWKALQPLLKDSPRKKK